MSENEAATAAPEAPAPGTRRRSTSVNAKAAAKAPADRQRTARRAAPPYGARRKPRANR